MYVYNVYNVYVLQPSLFQVLGAEGVELPAGLVQPPSNSFNVSPGGGG